MQLSCPQCGRDPGGGIRQATGLLVCPYCSSPIMRSGEVGTHNSPEPTAPPVVHPPLGSQRSGDTVSDEEPLAPPRLLPPEPIPPPPASAPRVSVSPGLLPGVSESPSAPPPVQVQNPTMAAPILEPPRAAERSAAVSSPASPSEQVVHRLGSDARARQRLVKNAVLGVLCAVVLIALLLILL